MGSNIYAWTSDRPQMAVSVHTVNVQQHYQYQYQNINQDSQRYNDRDNDHDVHTELQCDREEERKSGVLQHQYTSSSFSSETFPISISTINGDNVHYSPIETII